MMITSKRKKLKKLSWSLLLPRLSRCSTDGIREVLGSACMV